MSEIFFFFLGGGGGIFGGSWEGGVFLVIGGNAGNQRPSRV